MHTIGARESGSWLRDKAPTGFAWLGVFGLLWWIATGLSPDSWWIGLPTVGAAALVAVALGARIPQLRWRALPTFLGFILVRSALGSADVALRALRPKLAIEPAIFDHPLRGDRGAVLLAMLVSLLPGTLAAGLQNGRLVVHSLAPPDVARREILALQELIARLLGVEGAPNDG